MAGLMKAHCTVSLTSMTSIAFLHWCKLEGFFVFSPNAQVESCANVSRTHLHASSPASSDCTAPLQCGSTSRSSSFPSFSAQAPWTDHSAALSEHLAPAAMYGGFRGNNLCNCCVELESPVLPLVPQAVLHPLWWFPSPQPSLQTQEHGNHSAKGVKVLQ